jgi:hypothetical protein
VLDTAVGIDRQRPSGVLLQAKRARSFCGFAKIRALPRRSVTLPHTENTHPLCPGRHQAMGPGGHAGDAAAGDAYWVQWRSRVISAAASDCDG